MENNRLSKEKVMKIIYSAVDDVNKLLPRESRLVKSPGSVLMGRSGKLDSLGLINMIVAVESNIENEFGVSISLVDARAMSQEKGPFGTIQALADYISTLLEEGSNV